MPTQTPSLSTALLRLLLVTLLVTPSTATAQSVQKSTGPSTLQSGTIGATETSPATSPVTFEKRYLVEVIVFNYLGQITADGEIWHRAPLFEFDPESFKSTSLYGSENTVPSEPQYGAGENVNDDVIQFTQLSALLPHLVKLYSDPRYSVATHAAWIQPLYEKRESVPVELISASELESTSAFRRAKNPITGSVQIFENRLLFVDLDIKNEFGGDAYSRSLSFAETDTSRPAGIYRLKEKRRVKLNEIHYFDHPFFGALVRVSRWQPES